VNTSSTSQSSDDPNRLTPLHAASSRGNFEVVKGLVEVGKAEVDKTTNDGGTTSNYTSLLFACQGGHLEVAKCLVEGGKADVDKAAHDGSTSLFVASCQGELEVVKYLVGNARRRRTRRPTMERLHSKWRNIAGTKK